MPHTKAYQAIQKQPERLLSRKMSEDFSDTSVKPPNCICFR